MKNHYLLYSLLLLLFWNTGLHKLYAQGDVPNFQLNGDATQLDNLCYQLTEASQWQTGSIWCYDQISLNQSFQVEFMLSFGCLDSAGADGIVFGFQPVDVSLGTVGEDIGFGFIAPSVGIEFDTYTNSNKGDPSYDHIAIIKNGDLAHWSGNNLAGPVQANANNPNIEDCNQHIVKVIWDAASTTLSVYFDCELRLTYTGNIKNTVFGGNPMVYWGFTSGTGGFGSAHQVCMIDATFFDPNPDTNLCQGESSQLTAPSGASYAWSPTTGLSSASSKITTATPNVSTIYTVTVTQICGATSTYAYEVIVNASPQPNIVGNSQFCAGGSTNLSLSAPFSSYLWSNTQTTASINANTANNYAVTVTDLNGCTGTDALTVTQVGGLTPIIIPSGSLCPGSSITLNTSETFAQYSWSNIQTTANITVSSPNTYTVTVTNSSGCTGTGQINIGYAPVDVQINGNLSFCEGNTTTLDAGATYAQYIWSTGDATQTATFNASDPNVTVTVTDSFGCIGTAATSVTQRLNPTPNISGSTSFCQGFSTTLDAGTGYAQYTWSTGDATQTATFNTSDPNVVVTVTDNFGCIGTANTSVSESTGLSPTITGNTDFCQGTSTTLTADSGYTTYNWSTGGTGTSVTLNASDPNIILTVTDATGCSGTATTAVTQHPNPTPNISGNIDFCEGNTTTLDAGATYAQYIWSTGDDTQTASFNTSDPNVTVTVTDSFGCIGTDNTSVTQHLNPTPNISGSTSFCEGFSTTLDAGAGYAQYTWSTGDATQTILVDEPIANLQLSVTDNFGCIGTANTSVSENTSLSPTITGNTDFCQGTSTTLTADSGYTNYNWSTGGTGTSVTLNASDPNIILTVTDATGCSGTATTAVTQHPNPTPNISGNIDFCEGNTTTLDAGATYAQYIWSTGDDTQTASFNTSDPNVTVTVTDSFGCIGTDNTSVTQHLNPTPNISGSTSFCEGFSTTLDAGTGYAQYTWSTGDATQTILVDEPIANLQLSVTDNFGCIGTANTSVSENTSLSPTITGNTNFCEGSTTTLTADSGYTNYNWSTGGTGTSVTLNASDPNITLTVTDATGCSGTATAAVTQHLNPTPNISGNIDFCEGNTTTLDAGATYAQYIWSTGDDTQTASFNTSDPNVTVTVTDSFGCIGTDNTSVTQHLNPTPNISGSTSFCEGFSTTLDAGTGYAQYTWSTGDATQTILVDEPIANLQLSVTDNFGCIGTANTSVSENTSLSPTITGNTDFCEGSTTTLTADSGYTNYNWSTGGTGTSVTLNASNPNIILTVTDATGCSGTVTTAVTQHLNPTPNISGALSFCTDGFTTLSSTGYNNYLWSTGEITESATITTPGTVSLTVTDANGCVGSQQTTVTEQAYLTPTITGNTDFCEGNTASIAAETGYTSYIWTTGNTNNQVIIDEGGIYSVTVSDANGCTGIGTTNVVMHPNPDPSISGNLSFAETSSTVLSAVGGNYNSYAWSSGSTEASIEVNNGGIYIVAVSDANGCTGSAAAIVNEQAIFDILIPNAFSPNNDGVNDVFRIVGLHIQNTKILISDRWGREVYNSTDTKQGWDGTTNGIEREMGVYAYTVWVKLDNGREKMYHGNVTLMR